MSEYEKLMELYYAYYGGNYSKHDLVERIAALEQQLAEARRIIEELIESTPQEQCSQDCGVDNCPWIHAKTFLGALPAPPVKGE